MIGDIRENVKIVKARIKAACEHIGKREDQIRVLVAGKYATADKIREIVDCGFTLIGENRVQDALVKREVLKDIPITWHMIGHLQTNKVKRAVEIFDFVESVDSIRLALLLSKRTQELGKVLPIFLEVNIGEEKQKFGITRENLLSMCRQITALKGLDVKGLMVMPPWPKEAEDSRPFFKQAASIFAQCQRICPQIEYLSMGTSVDFEVAIEEGADIIRIGRILFVGS